MYSIPLPGPYVGCVAQYTRTGFRAVWDGEHWRNEATGAISLWNVAKRDYEDVEMDADGKFAPVKEI